MSYTDDPIRDYDDYCREEEAVEAKYPKCDICGKTIFDDYLFDIDGVLYCEDCMLDEFRRPVDDFIDEGE